MTDVIDLVARLAECDGGPVPAELKAEYVALDPTAGATVADRLRGEHRGVLAQLVAAKADVRATAEEEVRRRVNGQADPGTMYHYRRQAWRGAWPALRSEALHGLLGEMVAAVQPHTEGDPAAVLVTMLVMFGSMCGPSPYFEVGTARHHCNLNAIVVGGTADRKGQTLDDGWHMLADLDVSWQDRRLGGFGSGEALVEHLAEAADCRLFVVETELSSVLKVAGRDGSTLSEKLRDAWDGRPLANRTKGNVLVAREHHVSVVGHVTPEVLRRFAADSTAAEDGMLNRWLMVCCRQAQLLAEPSPVPSTVRADLMRRLRPMLTAARQTGLMTRTAPARAQWRSIYEALNADRPTGALGGIVARGPVQVIRLALVYALADGSRFVDVEHQAAALAVWEYARASAEHVFGGPAGSPNADRLYRALVASDGGLTAAERFAVFGRNIRGEELRMAEELLLDRGLADRVRRPGARGRPADVMIATDSGAS